jgi:hypothetical protein
MGRDLIAEKIIQDLEVLCNNKLCDWKGPLQSLEKHVKNCIYEKPPEWLNKVQPKIQLDEKKEISDLLLEQVKFEYCQLEFQDEEFQERVNEEVSKKSLVERLYTKSQESRQLLESVFDQSQKTDRRKSIARNLSMNEYDSLFHCFSDEEEKSNKSKH